MNPECILIRRLEGGKGPLRAFATVRLYGTILVNGCRIIQQDGQGAFVTFPQEEGKAPVAPGEKKKYFPIVKVEDKNTMKAIEKVVLEAYAKDLVAVQAAVAPTPAPTPAPVAQAPIDGCPF